MKKLVFNTEGKVTGVELFSSILLCAGAIQTPAIIQRSGIQNGSGEKLRDHIGFTVNYMKFEEQVIYSGDYRFELNQNNIQILNEISKRTIRIAYRTQSDDDGNVYDFTEWASRHPGGKSLIANNHPQYRLFMQQSHSAAHWSGTVVVVGHQANIEHGRFNIDYNL